MRLRRWPQVPTTDSEAGSVVHGPVLLARTADVAVEVRSVTAYASGLELVLAGIARTRPPSPELHSAYEAAVTALQQAGEEDGPEVVLDLRLLVTVDDVYGPAESWMAETHCTSGGFSFNASFWIDRLPADRRLTLHVSWPALCLTESPCTLTLATPPAS